MREAEQQQAALIAEQRLCMSEMRAEGESTSAQAKADTRQHALMVEKLEGSMETLRASKEEFNTRALRAESQLSALSVRRPQQHRSPRIYLVCRRMLCVSTLRMILQPGIFPFPVLGFWGKYAFTTVRPLPVLPRYLGHCRAAVSF